MVVEARQGRIPTFRNYDRIWKMELIALYNVFTAIKIMQWYGPVG
jgi:hypothetical protein